MNGQPLTVQELKRYVFPHNDQQRLTATELDGDPGELIWIDVHAWHKVAQ
jgi:hypothetical protein